MNILITGGSGFIGAVVIRQLLSTSQVSRIVNLDIADSPLKDSRLHTVTADIRESAIKSLPIEGSFDCCIHLAALCKEPGYEWEEYFDTNDAGTRNVIGLCERLSIQKILFTSTMMVYRAGEIRRTEESATAPDTAYGISKLLAEKELSAWEAGGGDRCLKIIRPAVVFGEAEHGNFTRLHHAIKRGFFPYVGKSSTVKSNVYVKELANFIGFLIINNPRETVYNFSFPETYTIRSIVNLMKDVFGLKAFNPVLPLKPQQWISYVLELLNQMGLRNGIHHRRIEKLYYSTDVYPENALKAGYIFQYDLRTALEDWKLSGDLG